MAGHTHFDESTEEYLEAIYRLDREGPGVTTSGLAADLGVAPASVSGMLKKLASEGYLSYVCARRGQADPTGTQRCGPGHAAPPASGMLPYEHLGDAVGRSE